MYSISKNRRATIISMKQHFLQSQSWERFLNSQGEKTFRLNEENFSALCVLKETPVGNYLFLPYGPSLASIRDLGPAIKAISELAQKENCIFVRIEPINKLSTKTTSKLKLKKTKDYDPKHTIILDLEPSEEEILQNMNQSRRNFFRNYAKKGISVRTSKDKKDAKILIDFLNQITDSRHFSTHSEKYLTDQLDFDFATLYIAEFENKAIGAALCYDSEDTRFYAHAAASDEYRKLSPGVAILTQMIIDAKRNGQKYFDFWGATDSTNEKHPWYHFTQYKLSFGGKMVEYGGTYDLPINKTKYALYTTLRKINRAKRKLLHQ